MESSWHVENPTLVSVRIASNMSAENKHEALSISRKANSLLKKYSKKKKQTKP